MVGNLDPDVRKLDRTLQTRSWPAGGDFRVAETIDARSHPPPWKGRADGVLVMIPKYAEMTDSKMADWVLDGGVPAVSLTADWLDPRVPEFIVGADSLAELAAEHLTGCGCLFVPVRRFFGRDGVGHPREGLRRNAGPPRPAVG